MGKNVQNENKLTLLIKCNLTNLDEANKVSKLVTHVSKASFGKNVFYKKNVIAGNSNSQFVDFKIDIPKYHADGNENTVEVIEKYTNNLTIGLRLDSISFKMELELKVNEQNKIKKMIPKSL